MINGKEAMVEEFVLHRIGTGGAPSILSDYSAVLQGPEEQEFLRKLFLKPFANVVQTNEFAERDGEANVLEGICMKAAKSKDLVGISRAVAKHLIEVANAHEARSGELFVARFNGVELNGAVHDALGILKFDDKEVFIESRVEGEAIAMQLKRGLGGRKPDQALLVLFTPEAPT
ncbi:MAG: nucleoid-associated protein, partial [Flavobacteriales bacterium]|nr:nucleoid-associated protein [Flavobacteriales bacterium]